MNIASIGSGHIGGTLSKLWAASGHRVMFGSRDPHGERMRSLLREAGANAAAGTVREAAAFGEVLLLAVPPSELERIFADAGDLTGKIVINCTNRYDGKSADGEVRRLAGDARVVRAFHTLPWEVIAEPEYDAINASLFVSGDDAEAKAIVSGLAADIGLDPVDVGGSAEMAKVEEAIIALWGVFSPLYGRNYGLRVLRR
ncbi:NADPH-dependent F420 reductase [Paenibacillus cymbidii]|uniref:NADPH-dependent F420 reductase n=1 Tax=Paenibacillus cymbidii TaxID=1639034 RepID=UPI0010810E02|nr:NAD(P)-binding domain-containing protein [Paenibacillus cymbidii]